MYPSDGPLRPLHLRILEQAAEGRPVKVTARALGYSPLTISDERRMLVKRLQARNVTHAVAIAIRHGWI